MHARVSSLLTIEHGSLADVSFEDPSNAAQWIRAIVGPHDGPGEESFDLLVCTPAWLQQQIEKVAPVVGIHHLVVARWDAAYVDQIVRDLIEAPSADTWPELGERIGRIALWEFEGYKPVSGHPR
jgi:hypothetical protein